MGAIGYVVEIWDSYTWAVWWFESTGLHDHPGSGCR